MPIYEYECTACGHRQEALQKLGDEPLSECAACGEPALKKGITAASFRLSGSGWYETDFKSDNRRNIADKDSAESVGKKKSDQGGAANDAGQKKSDQGGAANDAGQKKSDQGGAANDAGQKKSGQGSAANDAGRKSQPAESKSTGTKTTPGGTRSS